MNKLYRIHELTKEEILKSINEFFINVNNNDEYCVDEARNLLNLYFEYFMRAHNLDTNSIRFVIHAIDPKELQATEYAFLLSGSKHDYDAYLDKSLMKSWKADPNMYEKIAYLLVDGGHEFFHIVQNENHIPTYQSIELKTAKAENAYQKNANYQNRKRLRHMIDNHISNIGVLHSSEIQADTKATETLKTMLDDLIKMNSDKSIISLLYALKHLVNKESKSRKSLYKVSEESERCVKKCLNDFKITL